MKRVVVAALMLLLMLVSACSGSVEPRGGINATSSPNGSTLERAPQCRQAGDLCDRMIDELNQVRNAVPNASYSGARRVTLSGDGRFILTATLIDPKNDAASVRDKVEAILRLQGWTRDTASARPAWKGAKEMSGWLFTFDVVAQATGSKVTAALYAPNPA